MIISRRETQDYPWIVIHLPFVLVQQLSPRQTPVNHLTNRHRRRIPATTATPSRNSSELRDTPHSEVAQCLRTNLSTKDSKPIYFQITNNRPGRFIDCRPELRKYRQSSKQYFRVTSCIDNLLYKQ